MGVVEGSRIRREYVIAPGRIEGKGRRGKPLCADYVLEYRNTRLADRGWWGRLRAAHCSIGCTGGLY